MLDLRSTKARRSRIVRARSTLLAILGSCCSVALVADLEGAHPWAGRQAQASETRAVTIDNYSFTPGTLTVAVGTTVTWTNRDSEVHTVVADGGAPSFRSAGLDTDDTFSFTFGQAGTFSYHCSLHPHMTGTITVR